ncbi:MAG: hypothetical protein GQ470_02295 [Gammaproteobacteria bacterium]|nr:hypothetical protein [Gammaproteobacteria bacterium]
MFARSVMPADAYMDVGGRATQEQFAEAGIHLKQRHYTCCATIARYRFRLSPE